MGRIRFIMDSPDHYVCKHHGLCGLVSWVHGKVIWAVVARPTDTARWHQAKTIKGAKRACGRVLREGRDWKERREASTEDLLAEFQRHAEAIEKGGPAQGLYARCNTMRRIWLELERRGENPVWPEGQKTQFLLTA